jgi:glucose/sorbosone dehydrogenase
VRAAARIVLLLAATLLTTASASAATLEPIGEFNQPIFITSDPGNANRLFVVERGGRVIEVEGSETSVFANLDQTEDLVSCCSGERGLLSIALAPDFDTSGRFYADYTGTAEAGGAAGDIHVDAFRHSEGSLLREPILTIEHHEFDNHNGGQLQFGPDGYLYISVGDGGGGGDELESGQDLTTLLAKILRIEPRPGEEPAYRIPPGNPFAGPSVKEEIWSYGLRNPWRFSFDRATGDLVIADVGQAAREEVDYAPSPEAGRVGGAGADYGWNCREGFIAYPEPEAACGEAGPFTDPVFDYPHLDPEDGSAYGCAIIGGYVVRDFTLDELNGRYVYADLCTGEIRSLLLPQKPGEGAFGDCSEGLSVEGPTSFGEDSAGRVYIASGNGSVYRLAPGNPVDCPERPSEAGPGPGAQPPQAHGGPAPLRLRIRASAHRRHRRRLTIAVAVVPCTSQRGLRVMLRRGGRPFGSRRLDRHCRARFHLRVRGRSTFRALLPNGAGTPFRSRRLLVRAGR